jgi:hypothetical protein
MAAIRLAWRPTGLNPFYPPRKRSSRDTGSRADNFRIVYIAEPVGCINSVRPAEYANLQGESSSRTAAPRRRDAHTPAGARPVRRRNTTFNSGS